MLNTLVHNQPVNKGLHWAMFVPTLVCRIRLRGGPLCINRPRKKFQKSVFDFMKCSNTILEERQLVKSCI